jgi:hypothetical protein
MMAFVYTVIGFVIHDSPVTVEGGASSGLDSPITVAGG